MDSVKDKYRSIIEKIFRDYIDFMGEEDGIQFEVVSDKERVGEASP